MEPGLRCKLPFGVDNVYVLPVRRQLKQEYGFGTPGGSGNNGVGEAMPVVGKEYDDRNLNAAEVEWIIQYQYQ